MQTKPICIALIISYSSLVLRYGTC